MVAEKYHILSRPQLRQLVDEHYEGDPYSLIEELSFKLASLGPSPSTFYHRSPGRLLTVDYALPTHEVIPSNAQTTHFYTNLSPASFSGLSEVKSQPQHTFWSQLAGGGTPEMMKPPMEMNTFKPRVESGVGKFDVDKYGFYLNFREPLKGTSETISPAFDPDSTLVTSLREISKIHESFELQWTRQFEQLVTKITREYYRTSPATTEEPGEVFGTGGSNFTPFRQEFVAMIHEKGIPPPCRGEMWLELSGARNLRVSGEYHQLIRDIESLVVRDEVVAKNLRELEVDVSRTLATNCYFNVLPDQTPGPCSQKLHRILVAFVAYKPSIGYFQGMNKIVGHLLLYSMYLHHAWDEEDVFWMFVAICTEVLPRYDDQPFFCRLDTIHSEHVMIMEKYLPLYVPELAKHIAHHGVDLANFTISWWLTFFIGVKSVSIDTWFKIVDVLFLVEDPTNEQGRSLKLIAMTLALFKCLEPAILEMTSPVTIYQTLDGNVTNYDPGLAIRGHDLMVNYAIYIKKLTCQELVAFRNKVIN